MKLPKPWWAGGGLLNLTLLLSLAGLRVDLDLCLPPPGTSFREELLPLCPTRPASASSPFSASEGWGRSPQLLAKGRLLREVRALGVPFIPRTRVDAWLVHSVATGDADGTHGLLGTAASSAVEDGGQAAPEGGGDPREAHHSPLAVEEEDPAAEPTAQENDILKEKSEAVDHTSQHEEDEEGVPAHLKSLQPSQKDENKMIDALDWEAEVITESRNESHLHWSDTSFSLEDLFQLLSSQPEHSLEGISLEDIPPFLSSVDESVNSSAHNINLSHAISHDVNLHEAMLLCPNNTFRRELARTSQAQEPFLQLNSHVNPEQAIPSMSFPPADNQMRNLTSQDLLYDLDANIFDGINLMSLATGFSPLEVSQLFEEPDSDSGLSLNSSYTTTTKSNSHCTCDDAVGYNSGLQSLCHDLGAVGGCYPEPRKHCYMDHRTLSAFHQDLKCQIFHDHTYHVQPGVLEPKSESFTWSEKSKKISGCHDDLERNLSRDEQRAKELHIPFSVDEIVQMPVDSFNSMLSRHYLTDLQVSLIRDIRRRGKNKVAAQNCRKRKLNIILSLEDDICNLQTKKEALKREQAQCNKAIGIMKQKLHDLYQDVFSRLRDDQGRPVNPSHYALQYSHNGTVLIVPKELVLSGNKKVAAKGKRERTK
ncbi:nuclear factor erythroid 2-related factor 3 isoform X2 [Mesocricetus auratus]|uniref:Nuclear factor erythroid 2-related factor 3 isoform X2 n=1 Tax=Mesocricetus auratus TaxID=10036 RepID=A0ABM2WSM8_MESAU|nr:nuclear factor erythroid 2-related factor 3 isoform X2 [Mesocricetus auratus]